MGIPNSRDKIAIELSYFFRPKRKVSHIIRLTIKWKKNYGIFLFQANTDQLYLQETLYLLLEWKQ